MKHPMCFFNKYIDTLCMQTLSIHFDISPKHLHRTFHTKKCMQSSAVDTLYNIARHSEFFLHLRCASWRPTPSCIFINSSEEIRAWDTMRFDKCETLHKTLKMWEKISATQLLRGCAKYAGKYVPDIRNSCMLHSDNFFC